MKKRASLTRSRSSYLIQPKALQHKPRAEPLLSPFPPHVHRYLFSGREIRLCDRSGTSIERVAEAGLSARRQLDVITAKLERKPEEVRMHIKRKTLPTSPEDSNHPYHLTEAICNTLKTYAEKMRKVTEPKEEMLLESESDREEVQSPPKPSAQLLQFLASIATKERKSRPRHRAIRCLSLEHFPLPRRGSHPGIWSPSTSTSGLNSPVSGKGKRRMVGSVRNSPEPALRTSGKPIKKLRLMRVFSVMS